MKNLFTQQISDRFINICDGIIKRDFNGKDARMAKALGISTVVYSDIKRKKQNCTLEHVSKLLTNYKEIDARWLLTGEEKNDYILRDYEINNLVRKTSEFDEKYSDINNLQSYLENELMKKNTQINHLQSEIKIIETGLKEIKDTNQNSQSLRNCEDDKTVTT